MDRNMTRTERITEDILTMARQFATKAYEIQFEAYQLDLAGLFRQLDQEREVSARVAAELLKQK
jgi:hypothetical protein